MANRPPDDTDRQWGNPWGEHRSLHPADIKLRRAGYKVYSRPAHGPAIWESPEHVLLTEEEALAELEARPA